MKCLPMSPLVVAPQIAKPATSAQNVRTFAARRSTTSARTAGFTGLRTGCVGTASSGAPYGVIPRSAGELRRKFANGGMTVVVYLAFLALFRAPELQVALGAVRRFLPGR